MANYEHLLNDLKTMHRERNWNFFHKSKDLLIAMMSEVGELADLYRWLDDDTLDQMHKNPDTKKKIAYEMADILSYLMTLAYSSDIDLLQALKEKNEIVKRKYPVEQIRNKDTNSLLGNKPKNFK